MSGVLIKNFTRQHLKVWAGLPFAKIAKDILHDWDVSLVFVGAMKARKLNEKLRGKTYIPNVLSYIAGDKSAEIIICLAEVRREAPAYNLLPTTYCLFLFIHAALHVKGWVHGAKMEGCERNLLARYETTHSNRNRHRYVPSKNGRRRGTPR